MALGAAACQPAVPAYVVNVPPRILDVRPPRSVALVRGDVSLDGLRAALESAIPADVSGGATTTIANLRDAAATWHLSRRPVVLRAERDNLTLEVALLGDIDVQADGVRCHGGEAGVVFRVDTSPTLRPNGALALDHLAWKPEPRGELHCGVLPLPVGPLLDMIAEPLAGALARGVARIEIPMGPLFEATLHGLGAPQPLKLGDAGDACLDLDPEELVLSPVGGEGSDVRLVAGVDVAPRVTLAKCPRGSGPSSHGGAVVRVQPLRDDFEVTLAVAVPYSELEALVSKELVGKRFGKGSESVTIDGFQAGDANGRVLVRVPISGAVSGVLYLWGTPAVAPRGDRFILEVPDLHAALESQSLVAKLALVVLQFTNGGLENMLRSLLQIDVTDKISLAEKTLSGTRTLSAGPPAVVLSDELSRILPGVVRSRPGAMIVEPVVSGHAEVSVVPAGSP